MRKISATWIFPGNRPPLKNGILICEDDGTVIDLIDTGGQLGEQARLEQYSGILVPGFVNAHCHLELSHLKGKIPEKAGLSGFLGAINKLRNLEVENQLLLVNNTFTTQLDIEMIKKLRRMENTFFVLCPNANLYIENQLPPVLLFRHEKLNICLGTDSLASNHNYSILQEMIRLQNHFPEIALQELVEWGCVNGSLALGLTDFLGSLEPGKKPGVNLVTGADLHRLKLTEKSKVKRLM